MIFKIPLKLTDLESSIGDSDQFSISDEDVNENLSVIPIHSLHSIMTDYLNKISFETIKEYNFIVFIYSFLKQWDDFHEDESRALFAHLLIRSMAKVTEIIESRSDMLVDDEHLEFQQSIQNTLKMIVYFLSILLSKMNDDDKKKITENKSQGKRTKKKIIPNNIYGTKREDILLNLRELVTSNWAILLECFENKMDLSLTDTLFKIGIILLENPMKDIITTMKNSIFLYEKTIARICSSFSDYLGRYIFKRIIENENVAHLFPKIIQELKIDDGRTYYGSFVSDLILSCVEYDSSSEENSKNLAIFLEGCSISCPEVFLSNLELLVKNLLDSENQNIRSSTLELLKSICINVLKQQLDSISKNIRSSILENLSERVLDVNVNTRGKALQCWSDLMQENLVPLDKLPHIIDIAIQRLQDKSARVRKNAIKFLISTMKKNPFGPSLRKDVFENKFESIKIKLESEEFSTEEVESLEKELEICVKAIKYIDKLEIAKSKIYTLFIADSVLDVKAAINFATNASIYSIDSKFEGMKLFLKLVWSGNEDISKHVTKKFQKYFLQSNDDELSILGSLLSLLNFLQICSEEDIISLKKVIQKSIYDEIWLDRHTAVLLAILQQKYSTILNATSKSIQAAIILEMIFSVSKEYTNNFSGILLRTLKNNFYEYGVGSAEFFNAMKNIRSQDEEYPFDKDNKWIILTCKILLHEGNVIGDSIFLLQKGIQFIYWVCKEPDQVISSIIQHFLTAFQHDKQDWQSLTKLLFSIGECAINEVIYLNGCQLVEQKNKKKSSEDKDKNSTEIEKELGIVEDELESAQIEDKYNKLKNTLFERKWWIESLISLIEASTNQSVTIPILRNVAVSAQAKLCIASRKYCVENLHKIVSIMVNPTAPIDIRSNLITFMCDIISAHPNEAEGYISYLFQCVNDKSTLIRKHSILTISHLVLNGMMMITNNISIIARRITDSDEFICELAQSFFQLLQKKLGSDQYNPIYNHTPECISSLSELSEEELTFKDFMKIIDFLLSLISKESLHKNLTTTLASRFSLVNNLDPQRERKWKFIAYSLLTMKLQKSSFITLMDSFKQYKHVLLESLVITEIFLDIIKNQKKQISSSNDIAYKDQVTKFEESVLAIYNQFGENQVIEQKETIQDEIQMEEVQSENVEKDQDPQPQLEVLVTSGKKRKLKKSTLKSPKTSKRRRLSAETLPKEENNSISDEED